MEKEGQNALEVEEEEAKAPEESAEEESRRAVSALFFGQHDLLALQLSFSRKNVELWLQSDYG